MLGIVGFVTTKSADGVEADRADTKAPLESPQGSLESPQSSSEVPAVPAEVPAEPLARAPSAPSAIFATGEWTVRLGLHGKDGSTMKCTISDGGLFTCPDACGRGKPSSGRLELDPTEKKLTQIYIQNCGGGPLELVYDVEHVDRTSLSVKRERDWQNWSFVQ